jgi:hypothetical protein
LTKFAYTSLVSPESEQFPGAGSCVERRVGGDVRGPSPFVNVTEPESRRTVPCASGQPVVGQLCSVLCEQADTNDETRREVRKKDMPSL